MIETLPPWGGAVSSPYALRGHQSLAVLWAAVPPGYQTDVLVGWCSTPSQSKPSCSTMCTDKQATDKKMAVHLSTNTYVWSIRVLWWILFAKILFFNYFLLFMKIQWDRLEYAREGGGHEATATGRDRTRGAPIGSNTDELKRCEFIGSCLS